MANRTLIEYRVESQYRYVHNTVHRNNAPNKSQWLITDNEERDVFLTTIQRKWIEDGIGWGLYFINDHLDYLGVCPRRSNMLFIAKFVNGSVKRVWHGYPADYCNRGRDIPVESVLNDWERNNLVGPAKISKIARGKPCTL